MASINPARELFTSNHFGRIGFWNKYIDEFIFANGKLVLKDLNYAFNPEDFPFDAFNQYFPNKRKYFFKNENGKIQITINDFMFILPFPNGIFELIEVFQKQCYRYIKPVGRVIDVGAFIGDTAVYFASKGAKEVIAFEPSIMHEYAVVNARLNGFEKIVETRKMAVGIKRGTIQLNFNRNWPGMSSTVNRNKTSSIQTVPIISIAEVVQEYGKIGLLKMDCEGGEYEIFPHLENSGSLKNIQNIMLEVHGSDKIIKLILARNNFRIIRSEPINPNLSLLFACQK